MEGAKSVIALFLLVLFVIIAFGVGLSRYTSSKKTTSNGTPLQNILFPKKATPTPTPIKTAKGTDTIIIKEDSKVANPGNTTNSGNVQFETNKGTTTTTTNGTITNTKGATGTTGTTMTSGSSKGGVEEIPSTGTPTVVVLVSALGMGAGLLLRRSGVKS